MTPAEQSDFEKIVALIADLAANLPEFEGCKRPLKCGDAFKIRQKLDAMTAIKDELVKALEDALRFVDGVGTLAKCRAVLAKAKEIK